MQKYSFFSLLAVSMAIISCGPETLVSESRKVAEGTWTYADSLQFRATVKDTSRLYNIVLLVKHDKTYAFQNLYLRIHTRFPDGKVLLQPLSLDLAAKNGRWLGKCSGKTCKLEVPIQERAYFNLQGEYTFTLEQYMRQDSLSGIHALGLRITDAGPRPTGSPGQQEGGN